MTVLLIRGPKKLWPMVNYWDNFLPPQNLLCLAAYLEENGIDVKVIDSCINKWGWKSTKKAIEKINPTIVGTGEPITWADEGMRIIQIAKTINKDILTVVGGPHYFTIPDLYLYDGSPLDLIVYGEGEKTLLEIAQKHEKPNFKENLKEIRGIIFRKNGNIITTKPRPLIENLDELPFPAYHLVPMMRYERRNSLWKGGSTIYHGRGCISECSFCSCWLPFSRMNLKDGKIIKQSYYRTKSVDRTLEEMKLLEDKYKRTFMIFVDDTWNIKKKWNEEFAEKKIEWGLESKWFAFMRADFIIRDYKAGIFEKLVKSGLVHAIVGVERASTEDVLALNKKGYSSTKSYLAFRILQEYPQIFRQGTFVNGIWEDDKKSILAQADYARKIGVDYPSFHCLTPHPGTALWEEAEKEGRIEIYDFSKYTWFTPIMHTKYLSTDDVAKYTMYTNIKFVRNPLWLVKGLFSKHKTRRWNYWWFVKQIILSTLLALKERINPLTIDRNAEKTAYLRLVEPKWYND
ncbi:MAG: B12-binding domain-containing radical SAM protein [Promethearchaeia archaeon]